jgi:hypothetical protein
MSLNLDPVVVKLIGAVFFAVGIAAWAYAVKRLKNQSK